MVYDLIKHNTGIHPLLQEVNSTIGDDGFIQFFADDGNIVAPTVKMTSTTKLLTSVGPSLGYSMIYDSSHFLYYIIHNFKHSITFFL